VTGTTFVSRALDGVLAGPCAASPPPVEGPRRWWRGPLDVEGLAVESVRLALRAARAVAAVRGLAVDVDTTTYAAGLAFGSIDHLRVDGREPQGFAPLSGFFETADGWVRLHGNYPHHAEVLRRELRVEDRSELVRVLRELPAVETEQRLRAAGGIAGALRSPEDWRSSGAGRAVDESPWIAVGPAAAGAHDSARRPLPPGGGRPLDGIRVLDLTRVIAGPTGSKLLAALGADVLRVDPPHLPELLDQHLDTGNGKRSAVADLRDPSQLGRVHELLGKADVLLTGYRPGALVAAGLEGAVLRERHPHLVHVSLSAWGTEGPWAHERGFDSIVQSVTGIGHVYGSFDERDHWRPGALPVQALDHATGYGVAAAAMALLAARPERGGGSARLSLARTAHVLLDAGAGPDERVRPLPVETVALDTPHGRIECVRPPVSLDGVPVEPAPPGAYGAAELTWP
jgi:crotonobetainyl-CoA:carnitine CoA-transferase CaiB-like acyl-CoA transferase